MISGCTFRPAEITPEEARVLQTREYTASPEDIARAVTTVLQDMHYTLGTVTMDPGIITAERSSERRLAPISRESMSEEEIDQGIKTFFIVAGVIAVVGILLAWVFHDSDDDEDDEDEQDDYRPSRPRSHGRSHRSTTHVYTTSDDYASDSYLYTMTIMLDEIVPMQTRIRVTVQGQHFEGSRVVESGPVQTQAFYSDFYSRLDKILKY
jgi:hypothetical protein